MVKVKDSSIFDVVRKFVIIIFELLNPNFSINLTKLNPITMGVVGCSLPSPPLLWFLLINIKMAYIRTSSFFQYYIIIVVYKFSKKLFFSCMGGERSNGGLVFQKNQKWLITFVLIKLQA